MKERPPDMEEMDLSPQGCSGIVLMPALALLLLVVLVFVL